MKRVSIDQFLIYLPKVPVLDVRSPGEFTTGHLPGAHSFPLFSDEERAIVGTLYKQKGKSEAVKRGLDIVGPKMRSFVEKAAALQSDTLGLYCWRGGMRSESMAWLLERYGLKTIVLEGGYKAYRGQLHHFFEQALPLRVLTGYTGSQKTRFLGMLKAEGAQVIDLEGLAEHQGSSYGNQKCQGQATTEHFQNRLFEAFRQLDLDSPIWIEDEGIRIGQVHLPHGLFQRMKQSAHFFLEVNKQDRIDFLVQDYGHLDKKALIEATRRISKKLGGQHAARAIEHIQNGDLAAATEIILFYYDKRYHESIMRKKALIKAHYQVKSVELPALAIQLA